MSKQQWKFNLRFTLCLAGALLVLGVSLYFWHGFAVRRNSTALLHRADQLREQGDLKAEAKTLRSYLSLNPLDDAVLARLALTLDESADDPAKKAAAVQVLYRALAQPANSQRADLRRRQLRLLWETRRFEDAIEQSQYVLKVLADPDDALHREALVVQALAEVDSAAGSPLGANWSRIVGLLGDAIATNPPFLDHLELANRLATVYSDETVPIMVPNLTDSKAAETLMPMEDRRQRAARRWMNSWRNSPTSPRHILQDTATDSGLGRKVPRRIWNVPWLWPPTRPWKSGWVLENISGRPNLRHKPHWSAQRTAISKLLQPAQKTVEAILVSLVPTNPSHSSTRSQKYWTRQSSNSSPRCSRSTNAIST